MSVATSQPDILVSVVDASALAWQRDALCLEHLDVEYFPDRGESTEPGKEICRRCAVRTECLGYALANDIAEGVWGGTSGRQRQYGASHGLDVDAIIARADTPALRPAASPLESRPPCAQCGGDLARRDPGPLCWACRPAA